MAGRKFPVTSYGAMDCRWSAGHLAGPAPTSQWLWHAAHRAAARRAVDSIPAGADALARASTTVRAARPGTYYTARAADTVPSRYATPAFGQPSPVSTAYTPACDAGYTHGAWSSQAPEVEALLQYAGARSHARLSAQLKSLCRATRPRYALTVWPSPRYCHTPKALSRPGSNSRVRDGRGNDVRARSTRR